MTSQQIKKFLVVVLAATRRFRRRVRPFARAAAFAVALGTTACITDPGAGTDSDLCSDPTVICNPLPDEDNDGYTADIDCNDANPLIHPEANYAEDSEEYQTLADLAGNDGLDYNCDGESDFPIVIINRAPDQDGDGHDGFADCNDEDPLVYPGAEYDVGSDEWRELDERYPDGVDYDCDGTKDIYRIIGNPAPDEDGDGYVFGHDCNDQDPLVHPNAEYEPDSPEIRELSERYFEEGVDYNCDGEQDLPATIVNPMPDSDGDGWTDSEDCRPENPLVHPEASYAEGSAEEQRLIQLCIWDYDCDGEPDIEPFTNCFPDADGDGYTDGAWGGEEDCDDTNPLIHPNASYAEGSDEWSALLNLCQERGGELDYDCDGEADMECNNIIVNG